MSFAEVDSIGQGRVWSGTDAKRIGLIDEFGGLDDAIKVAAGLAKVKEYKVTRLPEMKDPFTELIDEISGKGKEDVYLKAYLGEQYGYLKSLLEIRDLRGIQARLPFEPVIR